MGPSWNVSEVTSAVLKLSDAVTTSAGKQLPMAPYLSWVFFGGKHTAELKCEVPEKKMNEQVQILMALGKARVPIVQWWLGIANCAI